MNVVIEKTLGKILAMQNILHAAPDRAWLGQTLTKALLDIPGVCSAALYLDSELVAQADNATPPKAWPPSSKSIESPDHEQSQQSLFTAHLETLDNNYGQIVLSLHDRLLFQPFQPHIENTLGIAALVIENMVQKKNLHELTVNLAEKVEEQVHEIKTQKAQLRQLFQNATYGIAIADPDSGIFTDCNNAFAAMLDRDTKEIVGQHQWRFHPVEEKGAGHLTQYFVDHLGKKSGEILLSKMIKSSGEIIDVEIKSTLVELSGKQFLQGFFKEVTESNRIREELIRTAREWQTTFDATNDAIWILDAEQRILRSNKAAERIFHRPTEEMVGAHCWSITHHTESPIPDCPITRSLESRKREMMELREGENWYQVIVDPIFDDTRQYAGAVHIVSDITERKRTEEEQLRLHEQLAQTLKIESIGQLAGGVAHDFNNMLGVILGHAEMALIKADPSSPFISNLVEIRTAANRSADLTRQLLTFARKQVIAPKVLDLNEAVAATLKMLQRLIGENIQLSWNPAAKLWPVKIDSSQLDQILANLCVNARDAIDHVGKISIKTTNTTWDTSAVASRPYDVVPGDYVQLCVSDDGCGMDKEAQSHIFEPFYTTKEVGSGTGLGLATVYGAVKQNHGFLTVYSEPGLGTVFNIYLPREAASVDTATETTTKTLYRGNETILLVEDDEMLLNMIKNMLEESGYAVLTAATTDLAQFIVKEHHGQIHLLISDMIMPVMNGKELSERLQLLRPELKVLYLSGYTAEIISKQGVLEGETHFLQKPFSFDVLTAKVREVLDEH